MKGQIMKICHIYQVVDTTHPGRVFDISSYSEPLVILDCLKDDPTIHHVGLDEFGVASIKGCPGRGLTPTQIPVTESLVYIGDGGFE